MHTLPLRTLLGRVALAALLPITLSACGDDVTGNTTDNDTEMEDDDDSATMTATMTTPTTMTMTGMTMTGMDTDPDDTDTADTDPDDTDTADTDPDTDTDTMDPDSSSSSGDESSSSSGAMTECTQLTVDGLNAANVGIDTYSASSNAFVGDEKLEDLFRVEFYDSVSGDVALDQAPEDNYATCISCVRLFEDFDDGGGLARQYYQSAGTLGVSPASDTLEAALTFTGVRLVEVTIAEDFTSTPVAGGGCIDIVDGTVETIPPCGNGAIDPDEDCDGENLNETTCSDLGNLQGDLACNKDCSFDQSACEAPTCGDDFAGGDEVCDGTDLAGQDCVTLGFSDGDLTCSDGCEAFVTEACNFTGYTQGFEDEVMPAEFALAGAADWFPTADQFQEGAQSAQAGDVDDGELSSMELDLTYASAGSIAFYYRVDSEEGFDFLDLYIDDVLTESWSGNVDWTEIVIPVAAGAHTFRWEYIKDGSVTTGEDTAWVDDIRAANGAL